MTDTKNIIEGLNDLLEKNYDSEKGFKNAAENVNDAGLKSFFKGKAQQRYDFGHEIKAEIKKLGGMPDKGGSMTGAAHRTWMDFKAALSFNTPEAVLDACETGEEAALEDYNEFLKENTLPADTRNVVAGQRSRIAGSLRTIEILEEQHDG